MNLGSKVGLCTDALHWDSSVISICVGVHFQNVNIELFSETVHHRILKLGMMVMYCEGFSKMHSLITSRKGLRSSGAIICAKKAPKLQHCTFLTVRHRNMKLAMMVVYNEGFPKMLIFITSRKGHRSYGAIIGKKAPNL